MKSGHEWENELGGVYGNIRREERVGGNSVVNNLKK